MVPDGLDQLFEAGGVPLGTGGGAVAEAGSSHPGGLSGGGGRQQATAVSSEGGDGQAAAFNGPSSSLNMALEVSPPVCVPASGGGCRQRRRVAQRRDVAPARP